MQDSEPLAIPPGLELPQPSETRRLDPRIRYVWMVGAIIPGVLMLAVAGGLAIADVPIAPWVLGGMGLTELTAGLLLPGARWRSWSYQLTDTELIIRFGVVVRVERWLPRTRIQHVDIIGGPIERSLGLRQIVIYTAGTREADVTVPGLRNDDAERLRAELLSWVKGTAPATDDGDDAAREQADFETDSEPEPAPDVQSSSFDEDAPPVANP
jgi:membrane protein YdbS with pleckstrin-like domain